MNNNDDVIGDDDDESATVGNSDNDKVGSDTLSLAEAEGSRIYYAFNDEENEKREKKKNKPSGVVDEESRNITNLEQANHKRQKVEK